MKSSLAFVVGLIVAVGVSGAWAGEGPVALQTAEPSCPSSSGVYADCGNGTVTDNRTGLVWLAEANCLGLMTWSEAMEFVSSLADLDDSFCMAEAPPGECDCGLSDGSSPGEWRLPSASEWAVMIGDALGEGLDPDCTVTPPTITNDSGGGCWITGPSSFSDVVSSVYWSSSTFASLSALNPSAFIVDLNNGGFGATTKTSTWYVWPVRGGQ